MKKRLLPLCLAGLLLCAPAQAEITLDGTVVAGETVALTAPFGGTVEAVAAQSGAEIALGDALCTLTTTPVYAPESGVVSGVLGQAGDAAATVAERYGAVLYIAPEGKYTISATINKAYNSQETRYVTVGETVYIACTAHGDHTAQGVITSAEGTSYTVQTTAGELLMEETVYIYRSPDLTASSRLGRGTVSRTPETAVTGEGSILRLHVRSGETVERGQLLFETVSGTLDGLYATDNTILAEASGIVTQLNVSVGQQVNQGDVLCTLCPRESMQVAVTVDEYDLGAVAPGAAVQLLFDGPEGAAETLTGQVAWISHVSASTSGDATYAVYIDFTPTDQTRLGMQATVVIE